MPPRQSITNQSTPPSRVIETMPRNQGTSRKGKPKKEMRSAGFGNALQRYVFYIGSITATTKWMECVWVIFENEWGIYVLLFNIFSENIYQWRLTSLWFWRSRSIATHIISMIGARSCCCCCFFGGWQNVTKNKCFFCGDDESILRIFLLMWTIASQWMYNLWDRTAAN